MRVAVLLLLAAVLAPAMPAGAAGPFRFYALTPCRIVDTRNAPGPTGGPALNHNTSRTFPIQGQCGVPSGAKAVALNVTITQPNGNGYLTLYPSDGAQPVVSNINFVANETALANGAIVPLGAAAPDLAVFAAVPFPQSSPPGRVHVILDVTGYFQ